MKKCTRCGLEKEESEFYKNRSQKTGLDPRCKECDKAKGKKYRDDNPEKHSQRGKDYYQRNKEKIQKKHLEYHHANREKLNEHNKKYYRENYLEIRRKHAEYREDHKVEAHQRSTQWRKDNPEKYKEYHREYRRRRNYVHDKVNIALKEGTLIKSKRCELCGEGGYIEGHHEDYNKPLEVVWCCKTCHMMLDKARRLREKRKKG